MAIELWVIFTLIAASSQTFRSAIQRQMKPVLGNDGASYIRFLYALPFAWIAVITYHYGWRIEIPETSLSFWFWITFAGIAQILFTVFLIRLFSHRSFAAGTAYSKTEVLQAAVLEAIILGVVVNLITGTAIILGVVAVIMLTLAKSQFTRRDMIKSCFSLTSAIGLASGTFLGFATVSYKAAIGALIGADFFMRAMYAGACGTAIQVILMGVWMLFFTRHELLQCLRHWQGSIGAGFFGALSTIAWFAAFALYAVAPVRAVGQVELLITLGISIMFFKEKTNKTELIAILLLSISIIMVLLGDG